MEPKQYKILVGSMFCNEECSIPLYIESLLKLDYPKEFIDLLWVENNSSDNTFNILKKYYRLIIKQFKYHSFQLLRVTGPYPSIPKEEIGTLRAGKRNIEDIELKEKVVKHMLSIQNFILEQVKDNDFVMYWYPDSLCQPNTLRTYIKDMETYPDCAWVGGVLHRRFPNHRRCSCRNSHHRENNPLNYGIGSPWMKFSEIPKTANSKWFIDMRKYGCPYFISFLSEGEIFERQKNDNGIFNDVCCNAHIWLMRKEIVEKGFMWRRFQGECGIAAERDLSKMGYKLYCDSFVYLTHISSNGKIYRNSLSLKLTEEEKIFEKSGEKEKIRLHEIENEKNQFMTLLIKLFNRNSGSISLESLRRPMQFESTRCSISGKILTRESWDSSIYSEFEEILEDKNLSEECFNEARRQYQEAMECKVPAGYRNLSPQQNEDKPSQDIIIPSTSPSLVPKEEDKLSSIFDEWKKPEEEPEEEIPEEISSSNSENEKSKGNAHPHP